MKKLCLKLLEKEDKNTLINMYKKIHETDPENIDKKQRYNAWANLSDEKWDIHIKCERDREKGLDEYLGFKMYKYYLVEDGEFIGTTEIKPDLENMSDEWQTYGGHLSYSIVPYKRGNGYGNEILHLALEKCALLNLSQIMISCREDNIASSKIIENNYGKLQKIILHESNENVEDNGSNYKIYNINVEDSLKRYISKLN